MTESSYMYTHKYLPYYDFVYSYVMTQSEDIFKKKFIINWQAIANKGIIGHFFRLF